MEDNLRLFFYLSITVCLVLYVNGQIEGTSCTNVEYVDFIPECIYGCFCVRKSGVARIECRNEPTSCEVSNACSNPEIKPGCKCPSCLQGRHCLAIDENGETVKVPEGASNVAVGCAVCNCVNVPTVSIFVDIINNQLDLGNLETREAECDYRSCPQTIINGLDGEDGEDATIFGPGRDGADGANGAAGFGVRAKHFANCAGVTDVMKRDSDADISSCDFGCFCMVNSGRKICLIPPQCRISNKCSDPDEGPCGCRRCPDNRRGSCTAVGPNDEFVTISDDGPKVVGGCAVCECEAPEVVDHHLYWQRSSRPTLRTRRAICDMSACVSTTPKPLCSETDPSMVFPSSSDIPECSFGCFCFTDGGPGLCIDPAPCFVTNKCIRPTSNCGCPTCPDVGNCIAQVGESFYLINDDGPKNVGPGGCATCRCDDVTDPVQFPGFWLPGSTPPTVPQRQATCDMKACNSGNSGSGGSGGSGGSTGGSGGSTGGSGGSTGGSGGSMGGSGGSTGGSGGSTDGSNGGSSNGNGGSGGVPSSCNNKPCIVSNKCTNPELDECGCPVCTTGNCIAVSSSGRRYTIKERRYVVVDKCARCRCLHDIVKAEFLNYKIPGSRKPHLPERFASCSYIC